MALVATFTDDFSGGTIDTAKWTTYTAVSSGAASVTQNNELIVDVDGTAWEFAWSIKPGPATNANASGVKSASNWEISGSSVYVRLFPPTAALTGDVLAHYFGFINEANDEGCAFLWTKLGGAAATLRFHVYWVMASGTKNADPAAAVTYDATNHAWLRLRHSANAGHGKMVWEAAPDNGAGSPGTWSILATTTSFANFDGTVSFITASRVYLGTAVMDGVIAESEITANGRFDGLNTPLTATAVGATLPFTLSLLGCGR